MADQANDIRGTGVGDAALVPFVLRMPSACLPQAQPLPQTPIRATVPIVIHLRQPSGAATITIGNL